MKQHLTQNWQQILLRIHQDKVGVIYKPGSNLYIADCLSRQNHLKNKGEEIRGMKLNIDVLWIDGHVQKLKRYISEGGPSARSYWTFRDVKAIIDGEAMKNRFLILTLLQQQVPDQFYINHNGIQKTRKLVREFEYWANMSNSIENVIECCTICLECKMVKYIEQIIPY